jgi:hypothetical protein
VSLGWYAGTGTVWDGGPPEKSVALDYFLRLHALLPGPSTSTARSQWYRAGYALDSGAFAVMYEGVGSAAGGVMVTVRQSALDALGDAALPSMLALSERLRAARVDLAADCPPAPPPSDLYRRWPAARSRSRPANVVLMQNQGGGETLTIGSRASDRYLRCYVKGSVVRHELELKHGLADGVWSRLREGESMQRVWESEYVRLVRWAA